MVTIVISHKVRNFDEFKKAFDEHEKMRVKEGIKITGLYCAADNKNQVTAISEAATVESAKAFISSSDLKAAMERAGVTSEPEIKILTKVQ